MQIVRRSSLVFVLLLAGMVGSGVAVVGSQLVEGGGWWGGLVAAGVVFFGLRRPWRRWHVARQPFPGAWRTWLQAHVPWYSRQGTEARARFERDIQFFLAEQRFEGVGVEVTETLRVAVAAGAALLLHGRPDWELPTHRTILFYAEAFDDQYFEGDGGTFAGMVHAQGPVLFSVRDVVRSWADPEDGFNVVLHELAHLLDYQNADADGSPALLDAASEGAWRDLVTREMRRIRLRRSLLSDYALTNRAEFFAVAVEVFFERPERMARQHRALFKALQAFFNLDPRV